MGYLNLCRRLCRMFFIFFRVDMLSILLIVVVQTYLVFCGNYQSLKTDQRWRQLSQLYSYGTCIENRHLSLLNEQTTLWSASNDSAKGITYILEEEENRDRNGVDDCSNVRR